VVRSSHQIGAGLVFQLGQPGQGLVGGMAAHLEAGLQTGADSRSFCLPKQQAALVVIKVRAGHAGRFALRQAGQGR